MAASLRGREPGSRGTSTVESVESWSCGRGRGQFGNREDGERPQLETATKQQLVKTEKIICVL
jgi:hypothetical protein